METVGSPAVAQADRLAAKATAARVAETGATYGALSKKALEKQIKTLEREMREAAKALEFETAAGLRDRIAVLRDRLMELA